MMSHRWPGSPPILAVLGVILSMPAPSNGKQQSHTDMLPSHSVSGYSAGGSAAVNHLVAFSKVVLGIGVLGAAPYGCNILPDCGDTCSGMDSSGAENTSIPWHRCFPLASTASTAPLRIHCCPLHPLLPSATTATHRCPLASAFLSGVEQVCTSGQHIPPEPVSQQRHRLTYPPRQQTSLPALRHTGCHSDPECDAGGRTTVPHTRCCCAHRVQPTSRPCMGC